MDWVLAIPTLPVAAFAVLVVMPRAVRNRMLWLPIGASVLSAAAAIYAFFQVHAGTDITSVAWARAWHLAVIGGRPFTVGLQLDSVAAVMLVVVTVVAACVQIYSLGYMHRDEREGWYYAALSLFTAAMLIVVLADNLLLLFAAWEIMGLCSYLLIGFWFELEAPRKASQKAFLTTRVGDLGFLFALVVIYNSIGTWQLSDVLASVHSWGPAAVTAAAIGLLVGAMGKSAQVPLHVWLPDAMAGPTPASALIHAATMVAAGVYLLIRMLPVLEAAPAVLTATLVIGAITGVVGGLLAAVQHDVKKVLAYSTISQLGLMFMAIGAGSAAAALFHLVTHAFFKSLLFLGAGVIIHSARTQDMREMGGLRKHMPITWITFLIGSLALAGVVPFSGFFSKDGIISALLGAGHVWAVAVLLVVSLLTAFYMTRLYFRVFEGPEQIEHLHDGHPSMLAPMVTLAAISCVVGFATTWFARFLGEAGEWPTVALIAISTCVAALGIYGGWWFYGRPWIVVNTRVYKQRFAWIYGALHSKLYFDAAYEAIFIHPYMAAADLLARFDHSGIDAVVNGVGKGWVLFASGAWRFDTDFIDSAVNGLAVVSKSAGRRLRTLQSGRLQSYQRLILAAVVLLMVFLVVKGA
jgi:NADH-quinone oxidoreductase subunit L